MGVSRPSEEPRSRRVDVRDDGSVFGPATLLPAAVACTRSRLAGAIRRSVSFGRVGPRRESVAAVEPRGPTTVGADESAERRQDAVWQRVLGTGQDAVRHAILLRLRN